MNAFYVGLEYPTNHTSTPISDRTANCQAHISGDGGAGWQFALRSVNSRGRLDYDYGEGPPGDELKLTQYVTVYFSASAGDSVCLCFFFFSPVFHHFSSFGS
ncbi:hypothetical protein F5Y17DRAFT_440993 [Xylariaceae sp. FL0594]|nr:hypothetical protein F5Y17DRAFT_440993 [Xylariaceae sp. FL0594]